MPHRLSTSVDGATIALLLVRGLVLVSVVVGIPHFPSAAATRYVAIAHSPGIPYRDFPVEYPVLESLLATLVGSWGLGVAAALLGVLAFSGDILAFASLRRGWGAQTARRYLWLGTPLLVFIYRRSDLVAVGLAAFAVTLTSRGRSRAGGVWLACATFVKLWPAALLPGWVLQRRRSALTSYAAAVLVGVTLWVALGGIGSVGQVATFRGATGWELESTVGVIVWARTGEYRFEQGANRTGTVPGWARSMLVLGLVLGTIAVWTRAARRRLEPWGAPALAAVTVLLTLSPVLSPQYAAWLLPWGAVAIATDRRWRVVAALPPFMTGMIVASWFLDLHLGTGWNQILLTARNLSLLAVLVAYFVLTRTDRDDTPGATQPSVTAPAAGG
jgi:hypothetical protein